MECLLVQRVDRLSEIERGRLLNDVLQQLSSIDRWAFPVRIR